MKIQEIKVGVFWRAFRNVEFQKRITDEVVDDSYYEGENLRQGLERAGFKTCMIEWKDNPISMYETIKKEEIDIVFNASSYKELVFLEAFNIPYVGTGIGTVSMDKAIRKIILQYYGIISPEFINIQNKFKIPTISLDYPLFIKPLRGRGSAGIDETNIVEKYEDIYKVVEKITDKIGQVALVEEFIEGREFTVGIIGYEDPEVLPIVEIGYKFGKTNTFEHKMLDNEIIICPMEIPIELEEEIKKISLETYKILDIKDYGRLDYILDKDNVPYFLEVNTFAGLNVPSSEEKTAHYGYMGYMAKEKGYSAEEFLKKIVISALKRYNIQTI